jgi:outer membrane lipoprotein carrier protein
MFIIAVFQRCLQGGKPLVLSSFLLGLWLGVVCLIHAADSADLEALIDRIQASYDRTTAITADFVQVATLTSIDRQQTSTGRVFIEKPHFIRWEYAQPEAQTILYDGNLLRIYTPKRRQVLQSPTDENNRSDVALLFLAGIGKLREAFVITPLATTETNGSQLRLLPRSRQAAFTELHIAVNRQSYLIERLTIYDTIGNVTDIRLQTIQTHAALPPQTFELSLPPNTEILTPKDVSGQR